MKSIVNLILLLLLLSVVFFTTCDSPMGMGKPIDWEPPVLTIDPVPNPLYVRYGTTLTGTATDNVGVDRIIFVNTATGKEIFPVVRNGDNWIIELLFTPEQNGEKIVSEIRAYDKMGNSGAMSVAIITMIIDIRPPVVENITIQRTDTRIARLEPWYALKTLETTDRLGEKKDNLYKYQNGWFYFNGVVNDEETKIEIISLDFYDTRDIDVKLLSLPVDEGYTNYFPRWTVKEENIINAGKGKWGESYKTDYYDAGERYYYRVVIRAIDMSANENEIIEEDEGFICMWAKSDEPKGILDPAIGTTVARGTPLPVDFFDDDSLLWAYTGLLTEEQWNGGEFINPGTSIPQGNDDSKLLWLKDYLLGGGTVYNWLYDKHNNDSSEPIKELIQFKDDGKSLDEKLVYVSTGKGENDYGDYVLFSLTADRKLSPHTGNGPEWTNTNLWAGKKWNISVVDENTPLIVFDTEKKTPDGQSKDFCPEENTFPELTDGEFFNIVGYTLRENATGQNKVTKFRMAWIPYGLPDLDGRPKGADGYIKMVQDALSNDFIGMPEHIQYWDFIENGGPGVGLFKNEGNETIEENIYIKQSFTKKLSVLGSSDDIKTSTKNFIYNGKLENETKLFVFYAVDTMGHEVFRQLRLLSNKTPPNLAVYDISNYLDTSNSDFSALPDPNKEIYITNGVLDPSKYYPVLNIVNNDKYPTLKGIIGSYKDGVRIPSQDDITIPFQIYPRGTILKYWINAENSGDISVDTISMRDITFSSEGQTVGSTYNPALRDLTFCEYYPDVTQRTFLFEAKDKLGNVARIQRTVAVTNAAKLENITTTSQNGTYGIDKEIILQANFSSQVYVTGGKPKLNIRYNASGSPRYAQIECTNDPMPTSYANSTSILEFKFKVSVNDGGKLETLYDDGGLTHSDGGLPFIPYDNDKRPIILPAGVSIMDSNRNDSAFIPGYQNESVTMPNWTDNKNSLQSKKNIMLDGVRPRITSVTAGGKALVDGNYYFKNGETLEFTLTSPDKDIRAGGTPSLYYILVDQGGSTVVEADATKFKYQRPSGQKALVFSLPVNDIASDGRIDSISLSVINGIVDNADNTVEYNSVQNLRMLITPPTPVIYIKKSIPSAPVVALARSKIGANPNTMIYYSSSPELEIDDSTSAWGSFEDVKQYSLDGGLKWITFPNAESGWTTTTTENGRSFLSINGGSWDLRVRYRDRAGNEGEQCKQLIYVNDVFPAIVSVTADEPNGWYASGNLNFNLNFAEAVRIESVSDVTITLTNKLASNTPNTDGTNSPEPSYQIKLEAASGQTNINRANPNTIKFVWYDIGTSGKEMRDGLYISDITLTGLIDKFGNSGKTVAGLPWSGNINTVGTCPNLSWTSLDNSIKADAIKPKIDTYSPINGGVTDYTVDTNDNKIITLTFNEPVMIGSGIITIKPRQGYKIPAVLEDSGYYLGTNGTRYTVAGTDRTYIAGFYDIYNNNALDIIDRNTLTQGSSMSNLTLDTRTGQSAGPYVKMTHGLKDGAGYSGNYPVGTDYENNAEQPGPTGTDYLIPDTTTKWVLDYRYSTDNANNTQYANILDVLLPADASVVPAIRAVLTKAKWRWQEIDIVSKVSISSDKKTVTINLNEPLLNGLQWELTFPEGVFTDIAGNKAPALSSGYWFWSKGVQTPVIRVNRKSFDARTANWATTTPAGTAVAGMRVYDVPANLNSPGGWGIIDFNTVYYRIETETPDATIYYRTEEGTEGNGGSVTANWTGTAGSFGGTTRTWQAPDVTATPGEWVTRNLIRRSGGTGGRAYSVMENNFSTTRTITANYKGYRSFNRDIKRSELVDPSITLSAGTSFQGSFTYNALQASKNYVVAEARITNSGTNYTSGKGYEGVFRSVIALNQTSFGGNLGGANSDNNPIMVQGSNNKNGMPSIAGFPVLDGGEMGDNRFIKLFYYQNTTGTVTALTSAQIYWVSTEIVSQWYELNSGKRRTDNASGQGGSSQTRGDVNNYLFSGYGDLSYALAQQ